MSLSKDLVHQVYKKNIFSHLSKFKISAFKIKYYSDLINGGFKITASMIFASDPETSNI